MSVKILFPESIKTNDLVQRIEESGVFRGPKPNPVDGVKIGHIDVREPKPDHPYACSYLPVAWIGDQVLFLVNEDEPALAEYHVLLRQIVTGLQ